MYTKLLMTTLRLLGLLAVLTLAGFLPIRTSTAGTQFFGPTPYLSFDDSPFESLAFDYFVLEDFEDGAFNVAGVTVNTGGISGPSNFTDSVDADDGVIDGVGRDGNSWSVGIPVLTYTFDQNVLGAFPTHAGIVWTDAGFAGVDEVTFEAFDGTGASLGTIGPSTVGVLPTSGQTAEDRFFGVFFAGGVSKIEIRGSSTDWEVDHLQFGLVSAVVPGPPTPIGGIGLLPSVDGVPLEAEGSSGPSPGVLAGVAAAITASAVALGGAAWYARRRR